MWRLCFTRLRKIQIKNINDLYDFEVQEAEAQLKVCASCAIAGCKIALISCVMSGGDPGVAGIDVTSTCARGSGGRHCADQR